MGTSVTHDAELEEVSISASERCRSWRDADIGRGRAWGEVVVLIAEPTECIDIVDAAVPASCMVVEPERSELAEESVLSLPEKACSDGGYVPVRECIALRLLLDIDAVKSEASWAASRARGSV